MDGNNSVDLATTQVSEGSSEKNSEGIREVNRIVSGKDEKADEDVPEDFFDDFLKEDFMAGLDIVDEDDEELGEQNEVESKPKVPRKVAKKKDSKGKKAYKSKTDYGKKFRDSSPKNSKILKKIKDHDSELKKLDKELEEMRHASSVKTEKYGVDADNFDIRRDPEKTRQAIQRDKIKSAKDKEKRLITDIVQTGLVPPGMELEVNIEEVCPVETREEKQEQITDLRQKIRPKKSRSKSAGHPKNSTRKRSPPGRRSPTPSKRRRSRTPTRNIIASSVEVSQGPKSAVGRNKSPLRRSPVPRRSPFNRRSPNTRRSPLGRRSPQVARSSDLQYGNYSPPRRSNRSPIRRTRSPLQSPSFWRRSRSRSLSDRRSSIYRRSRSRDRSASFRRRRDRTFSPLDIGRRRRTRSRSPKKPKKEEKISFLEELVAKLNETHPTQTNIPPLMEEAYLAPPVNYLMPNIPAAVATPVPPVVQQPPVGAPFFNSAPVPQPLPLQPAQPPVQEYDPYDESFFIGTAATLSKPQPNQFERDTSLLGNPTSMQFMQTNGISRYEEGPNSERDTAKLFGDKRIKLSDFLAITAKPQASNASSVKLQEKIKVIQRCHDAIKVLTERKFTGPLVVHKTDSYEYSKDMTVSPLLRKPIVQLPFTTPGTKNTNEMDFTKCCETLLYRIGLQKRLSSLKTQEKVNNIPSKEVTQKETPPLMFPSKQYSAPTLPSVKLITKSLSTQTDKELSSCKECLRRKGILYASCGIQAGDPTLTFSVSTQVSEADFYSMIPRTQSLASLTPAQLLGKQSMIADHTKLSSASRNLGPQEVRSRPRHIPSPPPPPIFHFTPPSQQESPYPLPLYSQPSISPLMQTRTSVSSNIQFKDDRHGGFNKRF